MAQRPFGGQHTEDKLDVLANYLKAFTIALSKSSFTTVYFDAFAGTGSIPKADADLPSLFGGEDLSTIAKGSARRALELPRPFDRYILVEQSPAKARELQHLADAHPNLADRIEVRVANANDALQRFCAEENWTRTRAVVFLDPFGNQVRWKTVLELSRVKADLWYLFPAGLGVSRQISRDGRVDQHHAASIDGLLGTSEWRQAFTEAVASEDMFGDHDVQMRKRADATAITRYVIDRLKGPFGGRVLDRWLRLGSRGVHMYSLLFAWGNPDEKARLAAKLAEAVLKPRRR